MFNFIKVVKYKKMYKEGKENLGNLVVDQTSDILTGLFVLPTVISLFVLVVLFLLGFTNVLTNPSMLARVFFFIILIGFLMFYFIYRIFYSFTSKISRDIGDGAEKFYNKEFKNKDTKVYDVDYELKK
jgi:hypothetical protein